MGIEYPDIILFLKVDPRIGPGLIQVRAILLGLVAAAGIPTVQFEELELLAGIFTPRHGTGHGFMDTFGSFLHT